MQPNNPQSKELQEFLKSIDPNFADFEESLKGELTDDLKSAMLLIDRRNNIMNFLRFGMPHIANSLYLPLGLYKKTFDEKETLGQFRDWKMPSENPTDQPTPYMLSPPEFLVHLRDTFFHLDQFLEVPSDISFNKLFKDSYDKIFKSYALRLKEANLQETALEDAVMNMEWVFKERFAVMYNKSLTSFQLGNQIEEYLSLFMSGLGANPFYKVEGLFREKLMDLGKFKDLFYEFREGEGEAGMKALPVALGFFFELEDKLELI